MSILTTLGLRAASSTTPPPGSLAASLLLTNWFIAYIVLSTRFIKHKYRLDHNVCPREDTAKYGPEMVKQGKITQSQLDMVKRWEACHLNSMENFAALGISSLLALHAGAPNATINGLMAGYTASRVAYAFSYILITTQGASFLRSFLFWVGNGCNIALMVAAGRVLSARQLVL
ncbi:hypothetical protein B0J14DRAFT_597084 [Halenospora varia]|nr:hypothetical protein B0J14DRAFT_597084 [Halenospora varia]